MLSDTEYGTPVAYPMRRIDRHVNTTPRGKMEDGGIALPIAFGPTPRRPPPAENASSSGAVTRLVSRWSKTLMSFPPGNCKR